MCFFVLFLFCLFCFCFVIVASVVNALLLHFCLFLRKRGSISQRHSLPAAVAHHLREPPEQLPWPCCSGFLHVWLFHFVPSFNCNYPVPVSPLAWEAINAACVRNCNYHSSLSLHLSKLTRRVPPVSDTVVIFFSLSHWYETTQYFLYLPLLLSRSSVSPRVGSSSINTVCVWSCGYHIFSVSPLVDIKSTLFLLLCLPTGGKQLDTVRYR